MDMWILLMLIAFAGAHAKSKQAKIAKAKAKYLSTFNMSFTVNPYEASLAYAIDFEQLIEQEVPREYEKNSIDKQYCRVLAAQAEVVKVFTKTCPGANYTQVYLQTIERVLPNVTENPTAVIPGLKRFIYEELDITHQARGLIKDLCRLYKDCDNIVSLITETYYVTPNETLPFKVLLKMGKFAQTYLSLHPLMKNAAKNETAVVDLLYTNAEDFVKLAHDTVDVAHAVYPHFGDECS